MPIHEKEPNQLGWWEMIKAVLYLVGENRKKYLFLNLLIFLTFCYDVVPPFIVGKIVDFFSTYQKGDSLNIFYGYVIFIVITSFSLSLLRLTSKNSLGKIVSQVVYDIKVNGFERLMDFSIKWHDKENSGNKVQKIQNGANAISQLQRQLGNEVFLNASIIVGVLVGFLILKPSFFLYSLIYIGIFFTIQARFYKKYLEINEEFNQSLEKASGTYYEGLSNVLTIKSLGVKGDMQKNISSREEYSRDTTNRMIKLGTDKWKFFQVINASFLGGILLLSGFGFINSTISLGSIFIFFTYFYRLTGAIGQSTNIFDQLVSHKISISRMMPIFWEKTVSKEGTKNFPSSWENIEIISGNLIYESSEDESINHALKDINIYISKNQKIGIVGKSGSGKSTLAKLFLALYGLKSGEYKIGSTNVYDIKHSEFTKEVALVLQDSEMFNLTLKENITLMREDNNKLFLLAIKISQLEDLIEKLPEGINTLIGEKGYRLSGGERQRIGIARAIYKDPQILILDEATSSLDSKTELLIQEGFEKNLTQKTIISIAHRISTLKNVDKVLVFENGKIIEQGKFKDLSEDKKSVFYSLYKNQS